MGPGLLNGLSDWRHAVDGGIIQQDNLTGLKMGKKEVFQEKQEEVSIERALKT